MMTKSGRSESVRTRRRRVRGSGRRSSIGWRSWATARGRNLPVERRFARGQPERLPALAAELVALTPDVLVTASTPATRAAKLASARIPIVFVGLGDPVATGLIVSFAQPGGNLTGTSMLAFDLGGKWIELLREIAPGVRRVAYLTDTSNPASVIGFERLREQALRLDTAVQVYDARQRSALERSLETIVRERHDGLVVGTNAILLDHREQIVQFAARTRLPTVYARGEYVEAGGLISYGSDNLGLYARGADYVHRIVQGAKPAELPVERPNTIQLTVNLKSARALGIKLPPRVLLGADRVIE